MTLFKAILNNPERALANANRHFGVMLPKDLLSGDPSVDKKLTQQVCQYYFKGQPVSEENLDTYVEVRFEKNGRKASNQNQQIHCVSFSFQFLGDTMFIVKFWAAMKLHLAKSNAPVFMYQFGYDGKYSFFKNTFRPEVQGTSNYSLKTEKNTHLERTVNLLATLNTVN